MFKTPETKRLFDGTGEHDTGMVEGTAYYTGKTGRACRPAPDPHQQNRSRPRQSFSLQHLFYHKCMEMELANLMNF